MAVTHRHRASVRAVANSRMELRLRHHVHVNAQFFLQMRSQTHEIQQVLPSGRSSSFTCEMPSLRFALLALHDQEQIILAAHL